MCQNFLDLIPVITSSRHPRHSHNPRAGLASSVLDPLPCRIQTGAIARPPPSSGESFGIVHATLPYTVFENRVLMVLESNCPRPSKVINQTPEFRWIDYCSFRMKTCLDHNHPRHDDCHTNAAVNVSCQPPQQHERARATVTTAMTTTIPTPPSRVDYHHTNTHVHDDNGGGECHDHESFSC